jgi:hypothetical protein
MNPDSRCKGGRLGMQGIPNGATTSSRNRRHSSAWLVVPAQAVDATPCNPLIQQHFSGRTGQGRSKPKQGSVLFELDDFQLLDSLQVGVDLVLRRPIEITRVTGQVVFGPVDMADKRVDSFCWSQKLHFGYTKKAKPLIETKQKGKNWRRGWDSNPRMEVLQTSPLGHLGTAPNF